MSIEKEMFQYTYSAGTAARDELLLWLQNNAADYFDEIVGYTDPDRNTAGIKMKINDVDVIDITPSAGKLTTIQLCNGASKSSSDGNIRWGVAYKTNNGIALFDVTDNRNYPLFITKGISGNTLCFACLKTAYSDYYYYGFDFVNGTTVYDMCGRGDTYPNLRRAVGRVAGATSLTPIIFGEGGDYSEGLYLAAFTESYASTRCIIDVNGVKYVFDGAIALGE